MIRFLLVATLATAAPSTLAAQDRNWKATLVASLKEAYPNTGTSSFQKNNVTKPGVVLVVKKPGIMAQNVNSTSFPASTVEAGNVAGPKGMGALFSNKPRDLAVGEKVYVRDIDVTDDRVRFELLTFEMYDVVEKGSTRRNRFVARVDWNFPKGTLQATQPANLQRLFAEVLVSETVAGAPKSIELGQTMADVEAALGKPDTVIKLGARVTYIYRNLKVIFTDGKVTDVQ